MMTKKLVMVIGVVFILVGLLGFVNDPVLGLFDVDLVHNLIHLGSGILALVFAKKGDYAARMYARVLGVIYGLVAIIGLASEDEILGLFQANSADDWLHIVLALVILAVGFCDLDKMNKMMGDMAAKKQASNPPSTPPSTPPTTPAGGV